MRNHGFLHSLILCALSAIALLYPKDSFAAEKLSKAVIIKEMRTLIETEQNARGKLSTKLRDALKEMASQDASMNNKNFDAHLDNYETQVSDIKNDLFENRMRLDFLEALTSKMESSSLANVKEELPEILIDLAHTRILSSSEVGEDDEIWTFEIFLSIAIKDIMEPTESVSEFIKKFMIYSSLREPRSPSGFLKDRKFI